MNRTQNNTIGYTDQQLDTQNAEAETRVPELMSGYGISEDQAWKAFSDEIAGRPVPIFYSAYSTALGDEVATMSSAVQASYDAYVNAQRNMDDDASLAFGEAWWRHKYAEIDAQGEHGDVGDKF
jgi:hypothetical protein